MSCDLDFGYCNLGSSLVYDTPLHYALRVAFAPKK